MDALGRGHVRHPCRGGQGADLLVIRGFVEHMDRTITVAARTLFRQIASQSPIIEGTERLQATPECKQLCGAASGDAFQD